MSGCEQIIELSKSDLQKLKPLVLKSLMISIIILHSIH